MPRLDVPDETEGCGFVSFQGGSGSVVGGRHQPLGSNRVRGIGLRLLNKPAGEFLILGGTVSSTSRDRMVNLVKVFQNVVTFICTLMCGQMAFF